MRRVVILGGGYAGLHAHAVLKRQLNRQLAAGTCEIILVSRDPYHTFHGWTGEILSGQLPVETTLTPIEPLVGNQFLQAEVLSLDASRNCLQLAVDGRVEELTFDHLLLATGSKDPFETLDGLAEHGWCIKDSRDMQKLVRRLEEIERSRAKVRNVVVVGGGFAGVETAAALAERFAGNGQTTIHLMSGTHELLEQLRPQFDRLADTAAAALRSSGVVVHAGQHAEAIECDHVRTADGYQLASDLTIVAAGISFSVLKGSEHLPRNGRGQLLTDCHLRVAGQHNIWAAGDLAEVLHPLTGAPCLANALWAMKQGDCVGRNIAAAVAGTRLKPFAFKGLGQTAGLPGGRGITELFGVQFTGRLAWLIRILFFAWYMPSRSRGFSLALELFSRMTRQSLSQKAHAWDSGSPASDPVRSIGVSAPAHWHRPS
ncbi:NAD(P)/FAD-dependent oxidoreductase [Devosia sp. RR2S18]|uniref:NAD(P)/FAD-dependent oxidoreductase n=1 Tax=Devosia rhizosphaerae TaxID=3049774 RepID=UPI002540597B|nr:FAD-dependent oxidoreductase [Devosia sp. RR2S18]WIJ23905.1 FAD-dependent oxidoreductase [Devosia sp. RR2S18]